MPVDSGGLEASALEEVDEACLPIDSPFVSPFGEGTTFTLLKGSGPGHGYQWDVGPAYGSEIPSPPPLVRAIAAGTVAAVRNRGGKSCGPSYPEPGCNCYGYACSDRWANYVTIAHTFGDQVVQSLYLHLANEGDDSPFAALAVGQEVAQGEAIGHLGSTGYSSHPHIHMQIQSNCSSYWCTPLAAFAPMGFRDTGWLHGGVSCVAGPG